MRAAATTVVECARCRELAARVEAIEARLAVLERARPSNAAADVMLLDVLANVSEGEPFRASWLLERARVDASLREALDARLLETAGGVGCWLRAHVGIHQRVLVERLRGGKWRATWRHHVGGLVEE